MKKNKFRFSLIFAYVFLVLGICLLLYPFLTDYIYKAIVNSNYKKFVATNKISTTTNSQEKLLLEQLFDKLQQQNEMLFENKSQEMSDPFFYEEPDIDLSQYGIDNDNIGYISIPTIDVTLPIYLGADTEKMAKGAVHLTKTSYPIGDNNTNSVIAAHRGFKKKRDV